MKIEEYDKRFEGRMNPRNTFDCDICGKFYNGDSTTSLMFNYEGTKLTDCHHGNNTEIPKEVFTEHIKDLENNLDGFRDEIDLFSE